MAEEKLIARGMFFTKFTVPATNLTQLFFFDPDGNGIELVAWFVRSSTGDIG